MRTNNNNTMYANKTTIQSEKNDITSHRHHRPTHTLLTSFYLHKSAKYSEICNSLVLSISKHNIFEAVTELNTPKDKCFA